MSSSVGEGSGGRPRRAWGTFLDIVRQRCPRCRRGRIFRGMFAMNDPCPDCGLLFEREEGYFLGAMYISYGLSSGILLAFFFGLHTLLPDWDGIVVTGLALLLYLPFVPAVFRYSRILWIYYDRSVDPHGALAGSYEKMRLKEIAAAKAKRSAGDNGLVE